MSATPDVDATTRAYSAVVELWNSVDRLTDEESSAKYVRLCNESRDGSDNIPPARLPPDLNASLEVLERAEIALEAIDCGKNLTGQVEQRLQEIRSWLLAVLAECNTTESEMQYARSRT